MASKMATLEDLYTDLLKDLYSAEKQLVKALPKMAKNAQSPELQKAFQEHLGQTEKHGRVSRIRQEHFLKQLDTICHLPIINFAIVCNCMLEVPS